MKKLRRVIFWCHLAAGVTAGVVILIMSVTGVLLAFERQVIRFAEREMQMVGQPSTDARRLGVGALLSKLSAARPDAKPTGLTLQSDPTAAATIALGRDGVLYMNPYTGEVTGQGARRTRAFFRVVEDWHRWLGTGGEHRAIGRAITGACNAAFLVLAITGAYLWWPKKWTWRKVRPVIFFQRGLKERARNFNWHNTAGFWSSSLLIIITATGMVMSYQWANNLLYRLTGSEPPAQQAPANRAGATPANERNDRPRTAGNQVQTAGGADRDANKAPRETGRPDQQSVAMAENLDKVWNRAEQQATGWESITLRLPLQPNAPVVFSIREGKAWLESASSQLTLNSASAEVVKWEPYSSASAGRKARTWARFLHTGEAGGVPGQILGFLACLGGTLLVWTGLALVWRRFRAWVKRRKASAAQPELELGLFDAQPEQTPEG